MRVVHQINSLYKALKLNQNFRKNKIVTGQTQFFVIAFALSILFVITLAFDRAVFFYENVVFSIFSTKKRFSSLKGIDNVQNCQ